MEHPLHTEEFLRRVRLCSGQHPGNRRTGRSTAIALRILADAISCPRRPIQVVDHDPRRCAQEHTFYMVHDMATALGLQHLKFNTHKFTVTFG